MPNQPVVAFGGSYGGMLAGWFRLKYPHIVVGAIAASAPIMQFYGTGVSQWVYNEIITQTFAAASPTCPGQLHQALLLIQNVSSSDAPALGRQFGVRKPPKRA